MVDPNSLPKVSGYWHKRCGYRCLTWPVRQNIKLWKGRPRCPVCSVFPTIATLISTSPAIEAAHRLGGPKAVKAMLKDS